MRIKIILCLNLFVILKILCKMRIFLQLIGLIIVVYRGTDFFFGIPATNFVFVGQQASVYCLAVAFFHLFLCRQSQFINFINLITKESLRTSQNDSPRSNIWRKRLFVYFHFIIGIVWVPIWFVRFLFRPGFVHVSRDNWYRIISGDKYDPSRMEGDLSMWKLVVGCLLTAARIDSMTLATCAVVLVYLLSRTVEDNAKHLVANLKQMHRFTTVQSNSVFTFIHPNLI